MLQLPSDDLRRIALQWMARLRREPHLGQRLNWRRGADLSSCRKVYFDDADDPFKTNFIALPREGGPRYRIVYQILPRPERPQSIRVIAVGLKKPADYSESVYRRAGGRLAP